MISEMPEAEDTEQDRHIREFIAPLYAIPPDDVPAMIRSLAVMLSGVDYQLLLLRQSIARLSFGGPADVHRPTDPADTSLPPTAK